MLLYKTLHIIFMVTWFAGLFYLPRLYVYHAQAEDQISRDRFKIMERKLFWGIMTPGAVLTVLFGVLLIEYHGMSYWLKMKILLVFVLALYHVWCGVLLEKFKTDSFLTPFWNLDPPLGPRPPFNNQEGSSTNTTFTNDPVRRSVNG